MKDILVVGDRVTSCVNELVDDTSNENDLDRESEGRVSEMRGDGLVMDLVGSEMEIVLVIVMPFMPVLE